MVLTQSDGAHGPSGKIGTRHRVRSPQRASGRLLQHVAPKIALVSARVPLSLSLSFYPYRFHSSVNESIQRGDPKSEQRPAVSGITRVQRLRSGPASEPRVPLKRATEERKEEREIPSARRGLANSWLNAQLTEASPRGRPAWPARVPLDGGGRGRSLVPLASPIRPPLPVLPLLQAASMTAGVVV